MTNKNKHQTIISLTLRLINILLVVASALMIFISFQNFQLIQSFLVQFASDGSIQGFNQNIFDSLRNKLLILGISLTVCAGLLTYWHQMLCSTLTIYFLEVIKFVKSFLENQKKFFTELSGIEKSCLCFLVLLGTVIRIIYMFRPLSYDEAFSYLTFINKPLVLALSNYSEPNNHLLNTFITWIFSSLFGESELVLRLPAFFSGILILPLTFILAERLADKNAALFSVALVSGSSALIEYSTSSRGYSLVVLLFLLLSLTYSEMRLTKNFRGACFFFVIFSSLGLYAIPIFLFPLVGIVIATVIWILQEKKFFVNMRILILAAVMTIVLVSVFYLPVLMRTGLSSLTSNVHVSSISGQKFLSELPQALSWSLELLTRDWPFLFNIIICLLLIVAIFLRSRSSIVLISCLAGLILVVIVQQVIPFRRTWIYLIPIFSIQAGIGFSKIISLIRTDTHQKLASGLSTLLGIVLVGCVYNNNGVLTSSDQGSFPEATKVAEYLKTLIKDGDKVVVIPPYDYPLKYYSRVFGLNEKIFELDERGSGNYYAVESRYPYQDKIGNPIIETIDKVVQYPYFKNSGSGCEREVTIVKTVHSLSDTSVYLITCQ